MVLCDDVIVLSYDVRVFFGEVILWCDDVIVLYNDVKVLCDDITTCCRKCFPMFSLVSMCFKILYTCRHVCKHVKNMLSTFFEGLNYDPIYIPPQSSLKLWNITWFYKILMTMKMLLYTSLVTNYVPKTLTLYICL